MCDFFPDNHLPFPPIDNFVIKTEVNKNYYSTLLSFTSHSVTSTQILVALPKIIPKIKNLLKLIKNYPEEDLPYYTIDRAITLLETIKDNFENEYELGSVLLNQNLVISQAGENITEILDELITLIKNEIPPANIANWKSQINKEKKKLLKFRRELEKELINIERHVHRTRFRFCANVNENQLPSHLETKIHEHIKSSKIWNLS